MIKYLLLFFIFLSVNYTGQQRQNPVLIEHNSILTKSGQNELISYRIPYKNLLFIKEGDIYNSSFSITFEFYKDDKFILREILNPELSVNEYDKTLSDEFYFQDYFQTSLSPGTYTLRSILSLGSTDVEYKIPDHKIDVDSTYKSKIVGPIIVVNSEKFSNEQTLANFGNSIPFSPTKYNLLIGLNTETDSLSINISQNDKVVFSEIFRSESNGNLSVKKVDNEIVLEFADSSEYEYFLVNGFSHLLYEGQFEITFSFSGTEKKYNLKTAWIGKPRVLNNPEYSIKLLSYIESENKVGELLSSDEEDYYKNLTEYWITNYPADGMKFNYAMEEYYRRAEYAMDNFSSLNAFDGAERDRGRIYILYGPPTSVERNYTEMNEILEIWQYKNFVRKFIFKDTNGTGKFDLTN